MSAPVRFRLHEEAAVFGVLDTAGPQVYFAETRERAVREVERANRIVELYPETISIGHLREMDAAWRLARGLPVPPEPAGRRVRVADTTGRGMAGARAEVSEVLELARGAAARRALEDRTAAEAWVLRTAVRVEREAGALQQALAPVLLRLRRALSTVRGERAEEAEAALWRAAGRRDVGAALPADARGDEELAAALERCAPLLARVARVLESGAEGGVAPVPPADLPPDVRLDLVRDAARTSASAARSALAELRTSYRRSLDVSGLLRTQWSSLSPAEREAVRSAVPGVDGLLGGRPGPFPAHPWRG